MAEGNLPPFNVPTTPAPLTTPQGPWTEYFGDATEQQYMLQDMRERHLAVLNQDGDNFFWCHRKTSGTICPYWDSNAGQCRDPLNQEATCYNTKYIGGYDTPLLVKIALPTSTRQFISQKEGLLTTQPMRCWTFWTPTISNRDMVVNLQTGARFEITDVVESGPWRGLIICQFFDLRLLQIDVDYGFKFPVNTTIS